MEDKHQSEAQIAQYLFESEIRSYADDQYQTRELQACDIPVGLELTLDGIVNWLEENGYIFEKTAYPDPRETMAGSCDVEITDDGLRWMASQRA